MEAARTLDGLYRAHAAEVFRYAYAVLGNRADAEDVTQTTFVNALRALERGESPRTPKNWLITIAHNLIRQRFRQQQSRPRQVELDQELPAVEAADDDGPSLDDLVRALQHIPPAQREALVLRELEGRSYAEIGELLGISHSALETLIFRARRSLAEEIEHLVTCDAAELALSRAADGRLGRKERRRLRAHLDECASCARTAARSLRYRRAFKTLAVLPLPFSLTLFKGAPTASAAAGLPTIGATAAGTGAAAGVSAKIAVGLAAVAVAGGAGYEGVKAVQGPPEAQPPAKVVKTSVPQAATPKPKQALAAARPAAAKLTPVTKKAARGKIVTTAKPRPKPKPELGRSAAAPGQMKPRPAKPVQTERRASGKAVGATKTRTSRGVGPAVEPTRGKSAAAPGQNRVTKPVTPAKAAGAGKANAATAEKQRKPQQPAAKKDRPEKPAKAAPTETPEPEPAAEGRPPKS
jgi:RNA polymerase sigma-70 factor (ECF subfamily)